MLAKDRHILNFISPENEIYLHLSMDGKVTCTGGTEVKAKQNQTCKAEVKRGAVPCPSACSLRESNKPF